MLFRSGPHWDGRCRIPVPPMGNPRRSPKGLPPASVEPPDLRCNLNDMRDREDARTALERARERRRQAKDEQAFSGLPTGNSTISDDSISPYGAGCQAFTADLRWLDWPNKFQPDLPEKYDGTIDPDEFLQIYTTTI